MPALRHVRTRGFWQALGSGARGLVRRRDPHTFYLATVWEERVSLSTSPSPRARSHGQGADCAPAGQAGRGKVRPRLGMGKGPGCSAGREGTARGTYPPWDCSGRLSGPGRTYLRASSRCGAAFKARRGPS